MIERIERIEANGSLVRYADGADPHAAGPRRHSRELESALRTGPFELAFRLALAESGLGLDALRRRLGAQGIQVGLSTLSYWQRGIRRPERDKSLRAVYTIEELLGLSRASLLALLGPPRPRGKRGDRPAALLDYQATIGKPDSLSVVLRDLDASVNNRFQHLSMQGERWIGPDRLWTIESVRRIVVPMTDDADRFVAVSAPDTPRENPPEIEAVHGCRVGRVRAEPDTGFHAAELIFDTPTRTGCPHVFDYRYLTRGGANYPVTHYYHGSRQPLRELMLRIHFDPAVLPVRSYRVRRRRWDEECGDVSELHPSAGGAISLVALDLEAGIEGFRWLWD